MMRYSLHAAALFGMMAMGTRVLLGQVSCTPSTPLPSSCQVTTTVALPVGAIFQMVLTAPGNETIAPQYDDFAIGYKDVVGPTAVVKANRSWSVSIRALTSTWDAVPGPGGGTPRSDKPAEDLLWSRNPGSGYAVVSSGSGSTIATGTATAGTSVQLYYRTLWSFATDSPGSYSITIGLTIAAP